MSLRYLFAGGYTEKITLGSGETVQGRCEGVYIFRLENDGTLKRTGVCEAKPNPTYLAKSPDGRGIYTVNEVNDYMNCDSAAVSAYEFDPANGGMKFLNRRASGGADACFITSDPQGKFLFTANYTGGSCCVFPICADHSLGAPCCFFRHTGSGADPVRQAGPHVHQVIIDPSGRHILADDLGRDEISVYGMDWEKGYMLPGSVSIHAPSGSGPRHSAFGRNDRLYTALEMSNEVCVFGYDNETGEGALLQRLSTLPSDYRGDNLTAAIRVHPDGRLLFCSNRGHDSIAVFRIGEDGLLELLNVQKTGGRIPRDFVLTPDGGFLLAAHQDSDDITVFAIGKDTGTLCQVYKESGVYTVTALLLSEYDI